MEEKLRSLLNNSYTPYYKYPVASVIVMKDGCEFYGVNVETSSPQAGICAERNAFLGNRQWQSIGCEIYNYRYTADSPHVYELP